MAQLKALHWKGTWLRRAICHGRDVMEAYVSDVESCGRRLRLAAVETETSALVRDAMAAEQLLDLAQRLSRELTEANTRLSEERTRLSKLLMPWETCDPVCSFIPECHVWTPCAARHDASLPGKLMALHDEFVPDLGPQAGVSCSRHAHCARQLLAAAL
ncbi:unnamed protein product [Symbiodinium necroappetens]|uniref:Uncharacterized protein n=1 Tax=Symbiodinium necroappetens TaxID=1628268 RepID=A0A812JME9_9DINO|nr:unnamed protein product [Symbiodinium necroappetens]